MAAYARAYLQVCLRVMDTGATLPLTDVEVNWCEDGTEALIMAADGEGHWAYASFALPRKMTEDEFYTWWREVNGVDGAADISIDRSDWRLT